MINKVASELLSRLALGPSTGDVLVEQVSLPDALSTLRALADAGLVARPRMALERCSSLPLAICCCPTFRVRRLWRCGGHLRLPPRLQADAGSSSGLRDSA